jgi:DNA repair exonuclease SbcCD ATPase subunit
MLKNMKQQIETITHDVEVLDTQLHTHLDRWYADWQTQIDETTLRLKADAKEYGDKKGNLERARARSYQLQLCMEQIQKTQQDVTILYADWNTDALEPKSYGTEDMINVWTKFYALVKSHAERVRTVNDILKNEYQGLDMSTLVKQRDDLSASIQKRAEQMGGIQTALQKNQENRERLALITQEMQQAEKRLKKWDIINKYFGGTKFRTLVQSYILRPLLNNANVYLRQITDRYELTCSEENEQLSILVLDRYNKNQVRSATVLSGGERFMISLSLSLALSSLNRPDMNVNILFIDEGFGTLDEKSLDSVMETLEKLQDIAGQNHRRVGIISHREELYDRIPVKIEVRKKGEGRSFISTT